MSAIRGDSPSQATDAQLGPWGTVIGFVAVVLLVGGLVALLFAGTRLAGSAAIAAGVDIVILWRVADLWRARPLEARTGRDALGMLANKLGAVLVPAAAVALVPRDTRVMGAVALAAGVVLVAASNLVIMRGRPPLNPTPPAPEKPSAGTAPATKRPRRVRPARPVPEAASWGPDDWLLIPLLLSAVCFLGGFLAAAVWEEQPYVGGWVMFGGAEAFGLSLSAYLWRIWRREDDGLQPAAASHLAATAGWLLVPVAAAAIPFDNGFGVVARGLAFVAVGLLVLGHARATAYPQLLRAADWVLVAVLAVCLPLTLLAAYGWFVRMGADYVSTYGVRTTIDLPYRCVATIREGSGSVSCDDARWTVDGVTYTGDVKGTVGEMSTGVFGHVGSVEGYATKRRAFAAEFVAESRPTGPVARYGRLPAWIGLAGVGAAASAVLLLWGPIRRRRPVSPRWRAARLSGGNYP